MHTVTENHDTQISTLDSPNSQAFLGYGPPDGHVDHGIPPNMQLAIKTHEKVLNLRDNTLLGDFSRSLSRLPGQW